MCVTLLHQLTGHHDTTTTTANSTPQATLGFIKIQFKKPEEQKISRKNLASASTEEFKDVRKPTESEHFVRANESPHSSREKKKQTKDHHAPKSEAVLLLEAKKVSCALVRVRARVR